MTTTPEQESLRRQRSIRISWRGLALVVILLLAVFLRLWRLESLPPGLNHDEAYNGLDALAILNRETFPIFHEGWELYAQDVHEAGPVYQTKTPVFLEGNYGREPLAAYLMAVSIVVFGNTPFALRLVVALAGVLGVLATYGAAYELTQEEDGQASDTTQVVDIIRSLVPLLAAFVVAVHFPSLLLSRFAVRAMLFVPIEGLVVFLFWRGIRTGAEAANGNDQRPSTASILGLAMTSPRWFAAAGFFLGLSLYTYGTARFFPLLFLIFVPLWLWRFRPALQRHLGDVALMTGFAAIAATPLLIFLFRHPYYLIYRSRFVGNRGEGTYPGRPWITWSYNVWRVLSGLVWQGDQNLSRNLPGRPFLDPLQVVLVIAGSIRIAVDGLSWRRVFLVLWLLVMLLPSILTGDAPHFARLIGLVIPLAILIGLGATWLVELLLARIGTGRERASLLALLAVLAMLLVSGQLAVRDYFDRYAIQPDLDTLFDTDDWQLGQYAAALPEDEIVYLSPTQEKMATIYFALAGARERLRSFYSPGQSLIPVGGVGESVYYLIRPRASAAIDLLSSRFPQGAIDLSFPSFTAFLLPAEVARYGPSSTQPFSWGGAISLKDWSVEQQDGMLVVTLVWQANVEMERSYTAYLHLLDDDGTLVAQLDRLPDGYPTSDWQPGEIVIDSYAIPLPPEIEPGVYALQTGFYHLPTDERLGEPTIIGGIEVR